LRAHLVVLTLLAACSSMPIEEPSPPPTQPADSVWRVPKPSKAANAPKSTDADARPEGTEGSASDADAATDDPQGAAAPPDAADPGDPVGAPPQPQQAPPAPEAPTDQTVEPPQDDPAPAEQPKQ
jgi:hypothetical protein